MNAMSERGTEPDDGTVFASSPELTYQAFLDEGVFRIQKCDDCARHVFYPRPVCPHCGGIRLSWVEPNGAGTVYSTTIVHRKPEEGGNYNVALIELLEGVRLMSRVDGLPPEEVTIGAPVRAGVVVEDGAGLVVFRPAGASS